MAALQQESLPQLLFRQCHLNCVDEPEAFGAESAAEKLCLANCQQKTYAAFDLYMAVRKHTSHRAVNQVVDVSRYTGMEVEHAHNTAGLINQKQGSHMDTGAVDDFVSDVRK